MKSTPPEITGITDGRTATRNDKNAVMHTVKVTNNPNSPQTVINSSDLGSLKKFFFPRKSDPETLFDVKQKDK